MVNAIATRLATWRQYRTSVRELSRLNDRELETLGLTRSDIQAVASGAPVMTCEEVDAVVSGRLNPAPHLFGEFPATAWSAVSPMALAA